MLNINFVPEDYVQNSESRRTNLMYLVLFAMVMAVLGGTFVTIKARQRALNAKENLANSQLAQVQESIKQFEELQVKRQAMMKTALTTAELLEPVPRSVLLASLTNSLPSGVSLLRLNLIQKERKEVSSHQGGTTTSKYEAEKTGAQQKLSPEKLLETYIDIEGIAPSDLQVAAYIEQLSGTSLLDNVTLVESKENKIEDTKFRQFKLKAMLKSDAHLTKGDIEKIKISEKTVRNW